MKLNSISIKRFGELRDFRLEPLPDGLTVIHGANGAGKTTLLNFVRFAIHGESAGQHRSRSQERSADGHVELDRDGQVLHVHRAIDATARDRFSVTDMATHGDASELLREWTDRIGADSFARLFAVGQREVHEFPAVIEDATRAGLLGRPGRDDALVKAAAQLRQQGQSLGAPGGTISQLTQRLAEIDAESRQQAAANARRIEELSRQHAAQSAELHAAEESTRQLETQLSAASHDAAGLQASIDEQERALQLELQAAEQRARDAFAELERLDAECLRSQAVIRDLDEHRRGVASEIERLSAAAALDSHDLSPAGLRDTVTRLEHKLNAIQQTLDAGHVPSPTGCANCQDGSKSITGVRREFFQLCAGVSRIETEDRIRHLRERHARIECAHADLQSHCEDLLATRAKVVQNLTHIPRIELVLRSHSSADFCRCEEHRTYWSEFRTALEASSALSGLIGENAAVTLSSPTTPGLKQTQDRLAAVERRRHETEQQLTEARRHLAKCLREMRADADSNGEDRLLELRFEHEVVSRQLADAVQSWCALRVAADIVKAFDDEREARRDPTVLEKASGYLNRLTAGHYQRIELGADGVIVVHATRGPAFTLDDLSRGTRYQISLRLVLAEEFAARGEAWPLILDDVFVDSDAKRTRIAVELLAECAARGCQIVYLTCHEYLCELFREIGVEPMSFADCLATPTRPLPIESRLGDLDTQMNRIPIANEDHVEIDALAARLDSTQLSPVPESLASVESALVDFSSSALSFEEPTSASTREAHEIQEDLRNNELEPPPEPIESSEPPRTTTVTSIPPATDISPDKHVVPVTSATLGLYSVETDERGSLPDHGRIRIEHRETSADAELADEDEFHLHPWSLTRQIPGLGQQAVRGLRALEIDVVGDLVQANPAALRQQLGRLRIPVDRFEQWQRQSRLMCRVPQLDGQCARILVACGFNTPYEILAADVPEILEAVTNYLNSASGRWAAETGVSIDERVITNWQHHAGRARAFARTPTSRRDRAVGGSGLQNRASRISYRDLRIDAGHTLRGPTQRGSLKSRGAIDSAKARAENQVAEDQLGKLVDQDVPADDVQTDNSPALQIWRGLGRPAVGDTNSLGNRQVAANERGGSNLRFYLFRSSDVVDAPTIGPRTADRLAVIGVRTVDDLLTRPADRIAAGLRHRRIKAKDVTEWQQQSELVCSVPGLRGHDAQVLVACGITSAESLARLEPTTLWGTIEPFVSSKHGERLLRSANKPDLAEVTNWITWARARHEFAADSGNATLTQLPKAG